MSTTHNVAVTCPECKAAGIPGIMTPIPDDHPAMIAGVPATAEVAASLGHETSFHPQNTRQRLLSPEYSPSTISTRLVNFDHGKDHN